MSNPTNRVTHQRAKRLRREMTGPERRLWPHLRNRRLANLKFRRQVPIGPFIVDFLCEEARLIVELDGHSHSDLGEYDRDREAHLRRLGHRLLRIDNDDVLADDLEPVLWAIVRAAGREIPGATSSDARNE